MGPQLADLAAAEERVLAAVERMRPEQVREPSRLAGWTRGHLVTHLARNADGNAAMVAAALRGERRPQYPGGTEQRARDIEAGADRDVTALAGDLRTAAAELAEVLRGVGDDQWETIVPAGVGPRSIRQRVASRLLEVEVHHADLDLGYGWAQWDDAFSSAQLDAWLDAVTTRCPDAPLGRWRIRVGDQSWLLRTGGYVDVAREDPDAAAGPPADGTVCGAPQLLLAWFLGRTSGADLRFEGEPLVRELPEWLPYG